MLWVCGIAFGLSWVVLVVGVLCFGVCVCVCLWFWVGWWVVCCLGLGVGCCVFARRVLGLGWLFLYSF